MLLLIGLSDFLVGKTLDWTGMGCCMGGGGAGVGLVGVDRYFKILILIIY